MHCPPIQNENDFSCSEKDTQILRNHYACRKKLPIMHRRNSDHEREFENILLTEICKTIQLMAKHGILPQGSTESVFSPDSDGSIWNEYPPLGIDMGFLLTGHISPATDDNRFDTALLGSMPFGNSDDTFYYTSLTVDVYIFIESSNSQQGQILKYLCV